MACVPPRAGFDTARKFPTAQEVLTSHCKMKQISVRSSLWHKTCRGWLPVLNVRNMASEAVVVEEMEAFEGNEASEKKTIRRQRWQAHETMALIAAKKHQDLTSVESTEAAGIELKKTRNKWKEVEAFCRERGIERSAQQCQARWFRLMSAFTQIRSWEETRKPEQMNFWSLKLDERKTMGFLLSLDQKTYNALDELYSSKADAIENALVTDNVEEVAELGSINHILHGYDGKKYNANKADMNVSNVQGEAREVRNQTNSRMIGYNSDEMVHVECCTNSMPIDKEINERYVGDANDDSLLEELEECSHGKQVDRCKAMENTKILSEFLQMVEDNRYEAQLPHVSTEKMDFNPVDLHTDQQVESLKVSGLADHTNPLILCDQKDVNDKAQFLPASAEMIDDSNEASGKVPLVVVDDCNKAWLLQANAENANINPMKLPTGQPEESSNFFEIGDHTISQNLPGRAKMIDGSIKRSCKGSLEEHGAEGKTIDMLRDGDGPSSRAMCDESVQALKDVGVEKDADGNLSKTTASVIDSVGVGGIADANSVAASVEESWECQKKDSLNVKQSTQITGTALSSLSFGKEDSGNYSVDRGLAEEAQIDKNEKGGSFLEALEGNSFLSLDKAEDISTGWTDNIQSNFIEAQNKNDACQTGEATVAQSNIFGPVMEEAYERSQMVLHTRFEQQEGELNPLLASEKERGTGVLKQAPEPNSQFPCCENFDRSICSDQDKESEKIEVCPPSEDGEIETTADMTERTATVLECSIGHNYEDTKVEHLQDDNNEYDEKTNEPSQTIKHFEVAVKETGTLVPCNQLQTDFDKDDNDRTERMKVTFKEGDCLTGHREIRASTIDTNPSAVKCVQQEFQHTSEQKSTIKGDGGSFESVSEANRVEVAAKEVESITRDDRGSPMTSGKGNKEDQIQKTTTGEEDVFMYIPAATGTFIKSALQSVRKFFKF